MRVLLQPKFDHFFNKAVRDGLVQRELNSPLARGVRFDFFVEPGRAGRDWVQAHMFLPSRKINNVPAVNFKRRYLVANGFGSVRYDLADGASDFFKDSLYIGRE